MYQKTGRAMNLGEAIDVLKASARTKKQKAAAQVLEHHLSTTVFMNRKPQYIPINGHEYEEKHAARAHDSRD